MHKAFYDRNQRIVPDSELGPLLGRQYSEPAPAAETLLVLGLSARDIEPFHLGPFGL